MLTVMTWLWGTKYDSSYVNKLAAGVRRNLRGPYRFMCITERSLSTDFSADVERHAIKDPELLAHKGCFARLRMFDPAWQARRGIKGKILSLDLDCVITGRLDLLAERNDSFAILQGVNTSNPCPFNGSVMLLRAGEHAEAWKDFSLERAQQLQYHEFPDDQGWLWSVIPNAGTITAQDKVYAFQKKEWPPGGDLPDLARIVAFPGRRDPSQFTQLWWVREHWR